jgi:hypothetical protein
MQNNYYWQMPHQMFGGNVNPQMMDMNMGGMQGNYLQQQPYNMQMMYQNQMYQNTQNDPNMMNMNQGDVQRNEIQK